MTDEDRYRAPSDTPPPTAPPNWATPGQQPVPAGTSAGLDPKIGGLLAYLLGPIGGLVIYLTQQDREVRFHGAQSVALGAASIAFWIAWTVLTFVIGQVPILGLLFSLLGLVVGLAIIALWIFMVVQGYSLQHRKLPVIGDLAEQWAVK